MIKKKNDKKKRTKIRDYYLDLEQIFKQYVQYQKIAAELRAKQLEEENHKLDADNMELSNRCGQLEDEKEGLEHTVWVKNTEIYDLKARIDKMINKQDHMQQDVTKILNDVQITNNQNRMLQNSVDTLESTTSSLHTTIGALHSGMREMHTDIKEVFIENRGYKAPKESEQQCFYLVKLHKGLDSAAPPDKPKYLMVRIMASKFPKRLNQIKQEFPDAFRCFTKSDINPETFAKQLRAELESRSYAYRSFNSYLRFDPGCSQNELIAAVVDLWEKLKKGKNTKYC